MSNNNYERKSFTEFGAKKIEHMSHRVFEKQNFLEQVYISIVTLLSLLPLFFINAGTNNRSLLEEFYEKNAMVELNMFVTIMFLYSINIFQLFLIYIVI